MYDLIRFKKVLLKALSSKEAELVSVVGRRRVGKTFLVKSVYGPKIKFSNTGLPNATKELQLETFSFELKKIGAENYDGKPIDSWLQAFFTLASHFSKNKPKEKYVIFFDELPWMATHRSGFITAFSWLWNSWAVNENVVIVICGSAASWMVQKVVRDTGGLHNRITRRVNVRPFNLHTTSEFLRLRGFRHDHYDCLQLYMAMGGIPHYLKEVEPGQSVTQNIDAICFSEDGILYDEFRNLYPAIFMDSDRHVEIIKLLANRPNGLSRSQLIKETQLSTGGRLTKILEELNISGFISEHFGFKNGKKRYRLIDEYSLFYLKFIEPMKSEGEGSWKTLSQKQTFRSWSGYAFENIGLRHVGQIKKALDIFAVFTKTSSYAHRAKDGFSGVQIDLVIDRGDRAINLCEFKFYDKEVVVSKDLQESLKKKRWAFEHYTKTRKTVYWTLISPFGIKQNQEGGNFIDQSLDASILFVAL